MLTAVTRRALAGVAALAALALWTPAGRAQSSAALPGQADYNGDGIGDLAIGAPLEDVGTAANAGAVHVLYGSPLGPTAGGGATGAPVNQLITQDSANVPGTSEGSDELGRALAFGDFDDDGFSDLAIGIPFEDTDSNQAADAGMVLVVFGSRNGLNLSRTQELISQRDGEQFGYALAAGDFDGDGVMDLAIGAPNRSVSAIDISSCFFKAGTIGGVACGVTSARAGGVTVHYGVAGSGLSTSRTDGFRQSDEYDGHISVFNEVGDAAQSGDRFGEALAAGDFDNDGRADLVVGAPGSDDLRWPSASANNAGAVHVVYGASSGLGRTSSKTLTITQDGVSNGSGLIAPGVGEGDGVTGTAEAGDLFGASLAVGVRSGADALYIGVPMENVGVVTQTGQITTVADAGAVLEIRRLATGADVLANDVVWSQETAGVQGGPESGDQFGYALASGDFNGDGNPDLAIGVPFEDVTDGSNRSDAGAVNVLYGNGSGLTDTDQIWTQASQPAYGVGSAQTNAWFGLSLAAGDFGNGSRSDLAIGAPGRNVNSVTDSGMVQVLNGTATGLDAGGNTWWHQDQPSIADQLEAGDGFGRVVK
jgi:hypothetical protein